MGWLSSIAIAQNPNSNPNAQAPWKLNGSQVDTTQFVGTINNVDLVFKRNNVESFRLLEDTAAKFFGNVYLDKFRIHPTPPPSSGPIQEARILTINPVGRIALSNLTIPQDDTYVCSYVTPWVFANGTTTDDDIALCPNFKSVTIAGDLTIGGITRLNTTAIGVAADNEIQLNMRSVGKEVGFRLLTIPSTATSSTKYAFQNRVITTNIIAYSVTNHSTNQDVFVVKGDGSVGIGTDNLNFSKLNVVAQNETGLTVATNHTGDYGYGIRSMVAKNKTKAFAVYNAETQEESFVVLGNGNVGIGTTAVNGAKLSVEGVIRARRVNVDAASIVWSDFVFEPNYNLMSLIQLENFIVKNKHLPDVPSATEVKEKGIDLAQMDAILLQKIEELTLYIIEQDKRINELEGK
ncbi:MAG: hypothetical protein K0B10_00195 [Vicingaceae bacterium]|nr:hypothetical protein [Vicingaceae bacterium]